MLVASAAASAEDEGGVGVGDGGFVLFRRLAGCRRWETFWVVLFRKGRRAWNRRFFHMIVLVVDGRFGRIGLSDRVTG